MRRGCSFFVTQFSVRGDLLSTGLVPVEATIDSYLALESPQLSLWLLRRVIHCPVQTTFAEPLLGGYSSKAFEKDNRKAARLNGVALENAFARRKTKTGLLIRSMVAVNRRFHGGKPRGEPSLKRLMSIPRSSLRSCLAIVPSADLPRGR